MRDSSTAWFNYLIVLFHLFVVWPIALLITLVVVEEVGDLIYGAFVLPQQYMNKRHRKLY